MPHGAPDWYQYRRASTTFPIADLAELAARLGSPVTFDRRGDVIFLDSFESGWPTWRTDISPPGGSVSLTPATSHHGGYSLKLTTNNTAFAMTKASRYVPCPHTSRIGFELAFAFETDVRSLWFYLGVWTGSGRSHIQVKYDPPNKELSIYTSAPTWTPIKSNLALAADPEHWHRLKLVADLITNKYVRLLLDDIVLDLSDLAVYSPWSDTAPQAEFQSYVNTNINDHKSTYIDAVIITQDEP